MSIRAISILCSVLLTIALLMIVGYRGATDYHFQRARENLKTAALQRLASTGITNDLIRDEIDWIRNPTPSEGFRWASAHVILMKNGEYLVYAWWHGANSGFVDHLFLARGSDDKWYYSTFHFCNQMGGILRDEPAGSIAEFAEHYFLREFDGKSDDCLKHTWPLKE